MYFSKYNRLPGKLAAEMLSAIQGPELYHAVSASLLRACLGKLSLVHTADLGQFAARRLLDPARGSIQLQPSYKESLIAWGLHAGSLTFSQYEGLVLNEKDWWVRKCALRELEENRYGRASYTDLLNKCLRVGEGEAARIAASLLLRDKLTLSKPYGDVEITAKQALKAAGVIRQIGRPSSRINVILAYIFGRAQTNYDWKRFFGKYHRDAEIITIFLKRNRESNIDAFLVQLDSFCDFLTRELWRRMKQGSQCPNYGHAIKDIALTTALPKTMACFLKLHDLRLQSATAHPRTKAGQPGRRLKHRDFYKLRPELVNAFDELENGVVP